MIVNPKHVTEVSVSGTEPVTTAYAKTHLRVDISDDDTLIGNLVTAAREYCERYLGQSLVQHTYRADLPTAYDVIELPHGPVQSITTIKYYDTASPQVLQTLSSNVYSLVNDTVRRNLGQSWASHATRSDAYQVTYVTGWKDTSSPQGTGESVPQAVKAAILLLTADLYENREAQIMYAGQLHDNRAVTMLLHPYRVYQ